jgi:Polyketide cyclase / dehydrase and lipid transport
MEVRVRRSCGAKIIIGAGPESVWSVVSDVTRVGEWSGECRGCEWVGTDTRLVPGAQFRGRNRRSGLRWTRLNQVVVADRPRSIIWRTVARFPYPDSVEWRIRLDPTDGGTEVTESFEILHIPKVMEWGVGIAMPAHRDRSTDLVDDLVRLKDLVESVSLAGR